MVVVQTSGRWRPTFGVASVFFASRFILARESPVFRDMFDSVDASSLKKPRIDGVDGLREERNVDQKEVPTFEGHKMIIVEDEPTDLQDFLEALHDYRCLLFLCLLTAHF